MHPDTTTHDRRWWTLAVLSFTLLIITIDGTVVNTALPTLARDLDASASQLQWIVDAYTLVFAGLLLIAGSLGDRFGRQRALFGGLVVFAAGSLAGPPRRPAGGRGSPPPPPGGAAPVGP